VSTGDVEEGARGRADAIVVVSGGLGGGGGEDLVRQRLAKELELGRDSYQSKEKDNHVRKT